MGNYELDRVRKWDQKLDEARKISIAAISRLIILSSSIVGFSVSLFSINSLQSQLDIDSLRFSWHLFMLTIITGFFILIFDGRMRYAKEWKNFQPSIFPEPGNFNYSLKEKFFATIIMLVSVFYPANLLFNRICRSEDEKKFKERVNGLVIHKLASMENALIFLENIVFVLFICGLMIMVSSFG
jgi:hypothetical protein